MEVAHCYAGSKGMLGKAFLSGAGGALGVVWMQRHVPAWLTATVGAVSGAAAMGIVSGSCFFIRHSSYLIPKLKFDRYWIGLLIGNIGITIGLGLVQSFVKTMAAAAPALGGGIVAGISPVVSAALISASVAASILSMAVVSLFLIDPRGIKDRLVEIGAGALGGSLVVGLAKAYL